MTLGDRQQLNRLNELQHFVVTYGAQQTQSVSLETMNHML